QENDYQGRKYIAEFEKIEKEYVSLFLKDKKSEECKQKGIEKDKIKNLFIDNENSYKYSSLCDILDALSGGKFYDSANKKFGNCVWSGKLEFEQNDLPIGHGSGKDFFSTLANRKMEIFADYIAMNYVSPESVEVLKKDFPELTKALDGIIDDISDKIKEL
ncbi:MAG: hypothetical protein J6T31_00995, partial [Methanobrevibacter sp.]|nr:hypothetical protein [Methanobrevibacter sp.]